MKKSNKTQSNLKKSENNSQIEDPENNSISGPILIPKHSRISYITFRQNPLPSPEELQKYKEIHKSFPERIIKMAEKEQRFRHVSTFLGQINFLILVIVGFGIASFTSIKGSQATGVAIAGAVGYIVYVFKSKNPRFPQDQKEET